MCNLYRIKNMASEVADMFGRPVQSETNAGGEIYPGYPGLVVSDSVRTMSWGFPLVLKSKRTGEPLKPKPVNNARTDKLGSPFWRASFRERRCLIPVSAYAEAQGPKGGKTRTWMSLPEQEMFACAGLWRDSAEWGPVFSMIMTEAGPGVAEVHSRMPVILPQTAWQDWASMPAEDAFALCVPYQDAIQIERTDTPWTRKNS